jgi:phosphoenolpyruvate synthase/pyruvate phosphate dikinase
MNKYQNYKLFYESHGYNFLLEDLIIHSYIKWDTLVVSVGDHVRKYVPGQTIVALKKSGLIITIEEIMNAQSNIGNLISNTCDIEISDKTIPDILENLSNILEQYSLFDTTYSEGIYENNSNDERLIQIENVKNVLRESFESLFFGENSLVEKVLLHISNSHNVNIDAIHWYRKEELLALIDTDKTLSEQEIKDRKNAYIFDRQGANITFLSGDNTKSIISEVSVTKSSVTELKGNIVSKSDHIIRGTVFVLHRDHSSNNSFTEDMETMPVNSILVTTMTDPAFLPAMKKSLAILTQTGGQLSHAAISARELKIPCIVGIENICSIVKSGDAVEINTSTGIIKII